MQLLVKILMIITLLSLSIKCYSQGENNIWFVTENIGLDFNGGVPITFETPLIGMPVTAVACDKSGNFLFFSNGVNVVDRTFQVMPNGKTQDVNYPGDLVLIVPFVNDTNRYYLFTRIGRTNNICYSVINMALNNGLGDIDTNFKNIPLAQNVSSAMIAVKGTGCFVWLLLHAYGTNEFWAYKIDANGVHINPVTSFSGFFSEIHSYNGANLDIGSDNKTLICSEPSMANAIEKHDFDNSTGKVSNAVLIDQYSSIGRVHAVCLSPDNTKLYVTGGPNGSDLIQYEINKSPIVINSILHYENGDSVYLNGDLRRGPDNKMYAATFQGIYCVDKPNLSGSACGFSTTCFTLPSTANPLPHSLGVEIITSIQLSINTSSVVTCLNKQFTISAPNGFDEYEWFNNRTTKEVSIKDHPGKVWVKSVSSCMIQIDTFNIKYEPCECEVHFPSAFTPNDDGLNDVFKVITEDIADFTMNIFNRWGQRVFTTDKSEHGWDGRFNGQKCDIGTYYYHGRVKCSGRFTQPFKGDLQLLR